MRNEGYGKYSKGGRGGVVYEVTNLNNSGEGSLRTAVEAPEPRTVVFRISGTIELESPLRIKSPFITIAGQTAPGDGICIKKYPLIIEADHVIIRYLRVRYGDESGEDSDAISSRYAKHLILDHISASWSVDETMSIYHCDSITVQWCIISESMFNSNHTRGVHPQDGSEYIEGLKRNEPWPAMAIHHQSPEEAYASVLDNAGATLPKRDPVDVRIIDEVRNGYATYEGPTYKMAHKVVDKSKKSGIIDSQDDVGGWPELKSKPAPTDTDHDGMPDYWEDANNLNKKDSKDKNSIAADGYTMLEKYLNSIK